MIYFIFDNYHIRYDFISTIIKSYHIPFSGMCWIIVWFTTNRNTARTGSVSLQSVAKRFEASLDNLSVATAEMIQKAHEYRDQEEARRRAHCVQSLPQF
nr:hypothetical protein Puna18p_00133 [Serratia proteamaculans]